MTAQSTPYRTHTCGELRASDEGAGVTLSGWVASVRDHGDLIFVDLRDRTGVTQIAFDPKRDEAAHSVAESLRSEFVVRVEGDVGLRGTDRVNPKLPTGEVEVNARSVEVLASAETPPFEIEDDIAAGEDVRLEYRYLDLRRPEMQRNLQVRSKAIHSLRGFLHGLDFVEVETPFLGKSTPEGARDYLVPSRKYPGKFYALPQSPQMYKQLLMVAGTEKYFQIARCMRDEDVRADRLAEFTQLDLEMSFTTPEEIFRVTEGAMRALFDGGAGIQIMTPFPRMTHAEAMERYGTDKPDTRFGVELFDFTDHAAESEFKVFAGAVESGGIVKGIRGPGWGSKKSRKDIDDLTKELSAWGARGLAWFKVGEGGEPSGGIAKFLSKEQAAAAVERSGALAGDNVMFVADKAKVVNASLAELRNRIGAEENLADPEDLSFLWVTDFPLFSWNENESRWDSEHHPFTMMREEDIPLLDSDPGKVRSLSYDLVLNGQECGSGSIRIHDSELQRKVFRTLKLTDEQIESKFGFFTRALRYGTPPHGGIAPGLDRLVWIMLRTKTMRDIVAFPKTQRGLDLMSGAPSEVDAAQMRELGLELTAEE